jgi:signal transduction histidine kinase
MRLDARILIPVGLASLLIGAASFVAAGSLETREAQANAADEARRISDRAAALLDSRMTDHIERLRLIENVAETTELQLHLIDPNDIKVPLLEQNLEILLQEVSEAVFAKISIYDANGQVAARYEAGVERLAPYAAPSLDVLAVLHHYLTSGDDAPFVYVRADELHVTVPLRAARGTFIGVIDGEESLETLTASLLPSLPPDARTLFTTGDAPAEEAGRIMASSPASLLRDPTGASQRVTAHSSVERPDSVLLGPRSALAVGLLMTLGVVLGVVTVSVRYNVQPLERIAQGLQRIGKGDRALHLDPVGPSELKVLANEVNHMVSELAQREREREAEMLARARLEKYATLGSLSAGVAHEVNNPLSAVRLANEQARIHLEQVHAAADLSEETKAHLDALDYTTRVNIDAVQRIQKIVQSLSLLSRPSKGETACDAGRVIDASLSLLRTRLKDRVNLVLDVPTDLRCNVDADGLGQIVLNLLLNALDAVPAQRGWILIRGRRIGERIRLEFEDNGGGIPLEVRKNIFKPFFTTKPKGTGLGLSVSQQIAESHHGTLTFEDREGGGTRFRLDVPSA